MASGHLYDTNALIVSPGKAMIDWVNSVFPNSYEVYRDEWTDDSATVYLIPAFISFDDVLEWLEENYQTIFRQELSGWIEDESRFPPITRDNFNAFCKVSYQSMVHVMGDEEE
jgi:hypothetical protein